MISEEQKFQVQALTQQIINLKASSNNRGIRTKKTIQILQQKIDKILEG